MLQKAVEGIQKYLIDSKYERNLKTAVDLYLTSAEQLYGGEVEKQILGKLVDWRTFERAAEPELKNYAYDKWHYAYIRAKWQLFLLAKMPSSILEPKNSKMAQRMENTFT